jgi:hypothetical protein
MKLLLTPEGVRDPVIDRLLETKIIEHLIPDQPIIRVLVCSDGKTTNLVGNYTAALNVPPQYHVSFQRLCRGLNECRNGEIQGVQVRPISFWDKEEDFQYKLATCDIFFMAGFTTGDDHIEAVYSEVGFQLKRHAVANRCVTNEMLCWGVCGSAVSFGCVWDVTWSGRNMGRNCEMLRMLGHKGWVNYASSTTPSEVVVTNDLQEWQMTSGTGLGVCITPNVQSAEAFRCVKSRINRWAWTQLADRMKGKLAEQVALLAQETTVYNGSQHGIRLWRFWWYGHCEWIDENKELEVNVA